MIDITKATPELIAAAAATDDLDEAIAPLQRAIGQTDGGAAGMFFSGEEGDQWSDPALRRGLIARYLCFEDGMAREPT